MRKLIDKLNYYTKLYDEGHPAISDKEYDDLYFKLVEMEKETGLIYPDSPTQTITYEVESSLKKIQHDTPMLSLDKTKDWGEFLNYFNNIHPGKDVVGMIKLDGLSLRLIYKGGKLIEASTRGEKGEVGEDVTHNARVVKTIPQSIDYQEDLVIDGEIICTYNDFLEFVDDYKNPRNFAAGSIRLLDSRECAKRNLTFVCWNVVTGFSEENSFMKRLDKLVKLGFTITPYTSSFDWDAKEFLIEQAKEFGFPIDGLVGRFNDVSFGTSLGRTEHHFKCALAFKLYDEEYETELIDIEWEPSRQGILTPVAVFKPIEISGSVVERASLHNLSIMRELLGKYPEKKQKIWVIKANEIIPQVVKAEYQNNQPHDHILDNGFISLCPKCGEPTKVEISESGVETLHCTNENCSCRIVNILDHYCGRSGMDIKGMSKATLEKVLDWGWVNSIKDIYTLSEHRQEWIRKPGFGPASVDKILDAIEQSKECGLDKFLVALGIPLVGTRAAKELNKVFKNWTEFFNSLNQNFKYYTLPNFGIEIHKSITNFNYEEANHIAENYLIFNVEEESEAKSLEGLTFVITGSLNLFRNRSELQAIIESMGGKVSGSVSRNTNYLINNDVESSSSKNLTAKRLGIPILSEEIFKKNFLE